MRKLIYEQIDKKWNDYILTEGTRSTIGIEMPNGRVLTTYCHWDGGTSWNGKILKKYYSDTKKVKELLKLGKAGISSLNKDYKGAEGHTFKDPVDGQTVFYGRDRGEKQDGVQSVKDREDVSGEEYDYLWSVKDKKWIYRDHGREWQALK